MKRPTPFYMQERSRCCGYSWGDFEVFRPREQSSRNFAGRRVGLPSAFGPLP